MHTIKYFCFLFLCFLMSILTSACGSKGDLYQAEAQEITQNSTVDKPQQSTDKIKKKQP